MAKTATLCEVPIVITEHQEQLLLRACERLGLDWQSIVKRVQAACQDAAVRRICELAGEGARPAPTFAPDVRAQTSTGEPRWAPSPALTAWYCNCGVRQPAEHETCESCGMQWEESTMWEVEPIRCMEKA